MPDEGVELTVGDEVEVVVGPVAHGGHCVARHQGRVIFVRHTLPGERVRVRITEGGTGDRFLRGDAVAVLEASPDRVEPRCPVSGPGGCGGCDFQHVSLEAQRRLKRDVVVEQLERLARLEDVPEVVVHPVPGDLDGLGYRTRVELAVDESGRVGLRRHRSHDVVAIDTCPIAAPEVDAAIGEVTAEMRQDPAAATDLAALDVIAPSGEPDAVVVEVPRDRREAPATVSLRERVALAHRDHELSVDARGFWQVHRGAPRAFVEAVLAAAAVQPGERVLDLYAGVGLLSVPLADATGVDGQLVAVESDRLAVEHLRSNLAGRPQAVVVPGRVDDLLGVPRPSRGRRGRRSAGGGRGARSDRLPPTADVVVLDPPRSGAGREVVRELAALRPRRLVYVACDPAALARDAGSLQEVGYRLSAIAAFDAFPMTHHVECVAIFENGR